MSFCIYESDIVFCNNEQIIVYNLDNGAETKLCLPELQIEKKPDVHNNANIETFHSITSVTFSNDGNYFLVCTNRKQLCLYERKTLNLISNKIVPRAASKVQFTPSNDIVVADKTGDAYLLAGNESNNKTLLLGHLSMLLDVLVTSNEKYIITTDRDEKVRVSMFPNSYNIVSYCLGHKKFVTNILELPHDNNILLSCGGDGTFILWDYKSGRDVLCIDFHDKISKSDVEKFNKQLHNLDESIEVLPVKHMKMSALSPASSIIVMSFYSNALLLVYVIKGTFESKFEATYLQSIVTNGEPIQCCLYKKNLWILDDLGFKVYEFDNNNFVANNEMNCKIINLNNCWKTLRKDNTQQDLFSILYKRKYDNVQEYLERKKTRLSSNVDA